RATPPRAIWDCQTWSLTFSYGPARVMLLRSTYGNARREVTWGLTFSEGPARATPPGRIGMSDPGSDNPIGAREGRNPPSAARWNAARHGRGRPPPPPTAQSRSEALRPTPRSRTLPASRQPAGKDGSYATNRCVPGVCRRAGRGAGFRHRAPGAGARAGAARRVGPGRGGHRLLRPEPVRRPRVAQRRAEPR